MHRANGSKCGFQGGSDTVLHTADCRQSIRRVFIPGFLMISALVCFSQHPEPFLQFDAASENSVQIGESGMILSWKSLTEQAALVPSDRGSNGPTLQQSAINGLPAVRFNDEGSSLALQTPLSSSLQIGSVHVFVVARMNGSEAAQMVLASGQDDPAIRLFSDGQNYRLRIGVTGNQQPEGPKIDGQVHLFEFHHTICKDLDAKISRSQWPGEFLIDGALCGKVFHAVADIPLDRLTLGNDPDQGMIPLKGDIAEILMFNCALDEAALFEIRSQLAKKWGVALEEQLSRDAIPRLKEMRVGPAGRNSAFAYFGESPESPDGSRVAYVVYPEEDSGYGASDIPVELWVCRADMTGHRLISTNAVLTSYHNGSMGHWVDNHRMLIGGDGYQEVKVINIETGEIEFGPYSRCWPGGIGYNGLVLLHTLAGSSLGGPSIHQLDTVTGEITTLVTAEYLASCYDRYQWTGRRNPENWRFVHGKYSLDGTHIAFSVAPRGGKQHLLSMRTDGSDLRIWGRFFPDTGSDKPLHWHWYDDELVYGADQESKDGTPDNLNIKLWDRDGNYIRTLAGQANHVAMSYDKKFFAGESFYYDDPTWLVIYRSGETVPAAVVFEEEGIRPTWIMGAHVNPAFSRDGRRLYYKRPVEDRLFQAFYAELDPLLSGEDEN
jgi:hypothetical protein